MFLEIVDFIKAWLFVWEKKTPTVDAPLRSLLAIPVVCPTRWWAHTSGNNLQWLPTWQDLEPPKRQAFIWAKLAYCVPQTAILTSDFYLWLCLLPRASWSFPFWEPVEEGVRLEYIASYSRVTRSDSNTLHLPWIKATVNYHSRYEKILLTIQPEEDLKDAGKHSRQLSWLILGN